MPSMTKQERNKEYYEKNYDKIYARMISKAHCPTCNCDLMYAGVSKHRKSKKHLAIIEKDRLALENQEKKI